MQEEQEIETEPAKKFLLIDGHALIYRAFHAYPPLTDPSGRMVNAVYGFTRIMLTVLRDQEPEYLAVAFDHKDPTFRHDSFKDYKAHREAMPEEMIPQIQIIKDMVMALNIPQFELSGFEADDLIGTLTAQAGKKEPPLHTIVVTGDKDILQLVDDYTSVFIPGRGNFSRDTLYNAEKVVEKMGVLPIQVPDLKGLMGDVSDNIPGVKGIGPKTAQLLIKQFGTVEQLYAVLDGKAEETVVEEYGQKGVTKKVVSKLVAERQQAMMSKELATIHRAAPVTLDLEACTVRQYDKDTVMALLDELNFKSLKPLLPDDSFEEALQTALF